jgi:hypothetical protein
MPARCFVNHAVQLLKTPTTLHIQVLTIGMEHDSQLRYSQLRNAPSVPRLF